MHHNPRLGAPQRGFTLIELMIVVAVVGVLALIAYPSFQDSVRKSRRADAAAGLMRLQQLQERYRGDKPAYASAVASMVSMGATSDSPEGHYTLSVEPLPVGKSAGSYYELSATAKAGSPQVADTKCRKLVLKMEGGNPTTTSFDASDTEDAANNNRCWVR
jgi:type IV pilus assembly protein PilE